jgi:hypothetical protein
MDINTFVPAIVAGGMTVFLLVLAGVTLYARG